MVLPKYPTDFRGSSRLWEVMSTKVGLSFGIKVCTRWPYNFSQQSGHGLSFFAFDQPQQYGDEVLPLAFAEARAKSFQVLA
jgi:hypothetical protein